MQKIVENLITTHLKLYEVQPRIFRSPGRVNIIGEHTDYNDGFVLPAAINLASFISISLRADDSIFLYSVLYDAQVETGLQNLAPMEEGWPNYILGVVYELKKRGAQLCGFNLVLDGEVPSGGGLSSSASIECAVAFGLQSLFNLPFTIIELAYIAQQAEHSFAGVKCGIMDQFASCLGKEGNAIKLDCRSLQYEYVPLDLKGYKILLLNTNVKHSLAGSEYNTRREQCEEGVQLIQKHMPEVLSLRDASIDMLDKWVIENKPVYNKCRYVVEEIQRVIESVHALQKGDLFQLGKEMFASHQGLSQMYEVSCKELDFLVNHVKNNPAVAGARMMGGGFGGCTINIVEENAIEGLVTEACREYENEMGLLLSHYVAETAGGSNEIFS